MLMKESKLSRLEGRYLNALQVRLVPGSDSSPGIPQALGKRALALGMGKPALAQMHALTLAALLAPGLSRAEAKDRSARSALFLSQACRSLEAGVALLKAPDPGKLLREAVRFQERLQALVHRLIATDEEHRMQVGLKRQEEIVQNLISVQLQITALDMELSKGTVEFKKEIASTQRMVRQSVKTVNKLARGSGTVHET